MRKYGTYFKLRLSNTVIIPLNYYNLDSCLISSLSILFSDPQVPLPPLKFLWLAFSYIFQRLFLCFLLYNLTMSNVSQKLLMAPPMVLVWHQLNVGIGVDQVKETVPVDLELAVFSSRNLIRYFWIYWKRYIICIFSCFRVDETNCGNTITNVSFSKYLNIQCTSNEK